MTKSQSTLNQTRTNVCAAGKSKDKPVDWETWTTGQLDRSHIKTPIRKSISRRRRKKASLLCGGQWKSKDVFIDGQQWKRGTTTEGRWRQERIYGPTNGADCEFWESKRYQCQRSITSVTAFLPDNPKNNLRALCKKPSSKLLHAHPGEDLNWKWKSPRRKRSLELKERSKNSSWGASKENWNLSLQQRRRQ